MPSKKEKETLEQEYRNKKLIMKIGIPIFMVVVIIFWIFNIKSTFDLNSQKSSEGIEFNWRDVNNDFSDKLSEVKDVIGEIRKDVEESKKEEDKELTDSDLKKLKEEILKEIKEEEENNKVEEDVSEEGNTNCPKFVNCMPGPDFKGCEVPLGCEEITIITY